MFSVTKTLSGSDVVLRSISSSRILSKVLAPQVPFFSSHLFISKYRGLQTHHNLSLLLLTSTKHICHLVSLPCEKGGEKKTILAYSSEISLWLECPHCQGLCLTLQVGLRLAGRRTHCKLQCCSLCCGVTA